MNKYRSWEDVPDNLKTKTALGRAGLRPAPGQQPTAVKTSNYYKTPDYDLYDVGQAVPKRKMTPKQQEALAKAQAASEAARTCQGCGFVEELGRPYRGKWYVRNGHCPSCREAIHEAVWREGAREDAAAWALSLIDAGDFIIMDTETTDLDGEVIELAIIDPSGATLFNRRFNPISPVSPGATAVNGLTNDMLASERPFPEMYKELASILAGASVVVIYNAGFDDGRLWHTCDLHGLLPIEYKSACAMEEYAAFVGERRGDGFRWQPLPGGDHTALGDCLATLDLIRHMAQAQVEPTAVSGAGNLTAVSKG